MSGNSIFLLGSDGKLVEMSEAPYETEDHLQALLADYPDLLAGAQINAGQPRRWLLVSRELGVPAEDGGGAHWTLDHLFVDQDAVPTLIEVKRSSDTRIRREVVGQMLDYAANGTKYWPIGELRTRFEDGCRAMGREPAELLEEFTGAPIDADGFWKEVEEHLRTGRIRMVFLSDTIPPELQRIVEFLNEQMNQTEVLAIEVKKFEGQGVQTYVPRVVGLTASAQQAKKSAGPRLKYPDLLDAATDEVREVEARLMKWAEAHGVTTRLSAAARQFLAPSGSTLFQLYPGFAQVEFPLEPFRSSDRAAEVDTVLVALRAISRRSITDKYPNLPCDDALAGWAELEDDVLPKMLALAASLPDQGASFGDGPNQ